MTQGVNSFEYTTMIIGRLRRKKKLITKNMYIFNIRRLQTSNSWADPGFGQRGGTKLTSKKRGKVITFKGGGRGAQGIFCVKRGDQPLVPPPLD